MAQYSDLIRNARLDQIEVTAGSTICLHIFTGVPPAAASSANTGTMCSSMNPPADWMGAATSGSKQKSGTWQDANADASGSPGHYRLYTSQVTKDGTTCFMQGTAGVGGGELNFDGTITAGQQVTINTFTITEGNP